MSEFIGIIPAAGKGSRLGLPYPKELHSVEPGVLYIDYALLQLKEAGVKKAIVVVSPEKLTPLASALRYARHDVELIYVETAPTDSNSLAGSVLRGCKRANYTYDYDKFVVVLPDTKYEFPGIVRELIAVPDAQCLGLFQVEDPSAYDCVYGEGHEALRVTVKKPVDASLGTPQGIWGCLTLDYQAVMRLRRLLRQTPKAESGDHHLLGNLIDADMQSGAPWYYLKVPGSYVDLGDWSRIQDYVAGIAGEDKK